MQCHSPEDNAYIEIKRYKLYIFIYIRAVTIYEPVDDRAYHWLFHINI